MDEKERRIAEQFDIPPLLACSWGDPAFEEHVAPTIRAFLEEERMEAEPHNDCRVGRAILWENGLTMVFCIHGVQMPRYQGKAEETLPRLRMDHPTVYVQEGQWRGPEGKPVSYSPEDWQV